MFGSGEPSVIRADKQFRLAGSNPALSLVGDLHATQDATYPDPDANEATIAADDGESLSDFIRQ